MKLLPVIAIILTLSLLTCSNMKNTNKHNNAGPISWEKVDSLDKKGLYKSAWEEVKLIDQQAQNNNDMTSQVKAIFYHLRYSQMIEENSDKLNVEFLEKRIATSNEPLQSILHCITGQMYWSQYQNNRYQILQRTDISGDAPEDIALWSARNYIDKVNEHYSASLVMKDELKSVKLEEIDKFFFNDKGNENFKYRISLYDFLTHRAIKFYRQSEAGLTQPADFFSLDDKSFLKDKSIFKTVKISDKHPDSFQYKTLKLYQNLLTYYDEIDAKDASLDADFQRLNWVYRNTPLKSKKALYLHSLDQLIKQYPSSNKTAEVIFKKVNLLDSDGAKYDPIQDDETYRWKRKEAVKLAETVLKNYPNTIGADQCENFISAAKFKNLNATVESVNLPNMASLAKLGYRNIDKVFCRIIKTNWTPSHKGQTFEHLLESLYKKESIKEWSINLKASEDLQNHNTEIILPALEKGQYTLLICDKPTYERNKSVVCYEDFFVTHISANRRTNQGESTYRILNRLNGEEITGATIEQYQVNGLNRPMTKQNLVETYTSDKNGEFETVNFEGYNQYQLKILWNGEELLIPHNDVGYGRNNIQERITTHFFIDRGIYRPGQTIHFKAITLKQKGYSTTLATNQKITIELLDVNRQKAEELSMVTNEYGTVHGTFTIPNNGLTGRMRLKCEYGQKQFSVEEYKRPKFEVTTSPIKGSYKLGETIKVEGTAIAYSGANLQEAEVKYTVYRSPKIKYFNWWFRCYIPPYAQGEKVKIKDGIIQTDNEGKFTFDFEAIDGGDAGKLWLDHYNYEISIDVTDINGETQSTKTTIGVGKKALVLKMTINNTIDLSDDNEYSIQATNLSGEPIATQGSLKLYRLISPETIKVDRYWNNMDQLSYTKEEFDAKISHIGYPGQNDKSKWKRKLLEEFSFDTERELDKKLLSKVKDGEYVIELEAKDSFGTMVKSTKYFNAYDPKSRDIFSYTPFDVIRKKDKYLPGDELELLLNTSLDELRVKIEIEHNHRIIHQKYMMLTHGKKTFTYPIKRDFQGGFTVHISGYKNNRSFMRSLNINVPRIDHQLDISLETFRDKMLPGAEEEWKIKVRNTNGDKNISEVLVNMYDSSLDQFVVNTRNFNPFKTKYPSLPWSNTIGTTTNSQQLSVYQKRKNIAPYYYPSLNWHSYSTNGRMYFSRGARGDEVIMDMSYDSDIEESIEQEVFLSASSNVGSPSIAFKSDLEESLIEKKDEAESTSFSPRTNFNETAFFYPDLMTDHDGNLVFKFTLPESLTAWKFQTFAHTKTLQYGMLDEEMISQKDLMVVPNLPRYFRQGDKITLQSKIINLSENNLAIVAGIKLFDAFSGQEITDKIITEGQETSHTLNAKGQILASWNLEFDDTLDAITWQVYAKSDTHNDAEESSLPILSNRTLVTETLPFALTNIKTKTITLEKLKNNHSSTLKNHSLTLEYNGNPVWYAIQAMPYMMEYPYDCAEQTFTRYYANTLSSHIMEQRPQIKKIIENWQQFSPESFLSNLEKNQELKSIILEESPWVLQSKNESERKKRISLLFDLNHMANQRNKAIRKLQETQLASGAWPWFKGMQPNLHITQHIVSGFGHLDKLGTEHSESENKMMTGALNYLDSEHLKRYYERKKNNSPHLGSFEIQYLYARSFFPNHEMRINKEAYDYYSSELKKNWTKHNTYMKGMVALILHRQGDGATSKDILKSLLETSIQSEEMGMYWKKDIYSWNWYEPTTERHALLIEAFSEINNDLESVNLLKTWLIMNKRTNDWKTTKATAEACYALLLQGNDWTTPTSYKITVGNHVIDSNDPQLVKEAGTGYVKKVWSKEEITPDMATVRINKMGESPSWGAIYWQYFEELDKITSAESPLTIRKQLYLVTETKDGEKLISINEKQIKIGDRIRVRLDVITDRDMNYIHIKDLRASGLEPIDVISRYQYKGGVGYYMNTRDSGTHFFIDNLRKGTYTLDYDLFVSHEGDFSNGIALIECMYAPEFSAHSEGVRLVIER